MSRSAVPETAVPEAAAGRRGRAADEHDELDALDPRARRPARRLGLGAAVVLVVVAVGIAAWLSATASGGGAQGEITGTAGGVLPADSMPIDGGPGVGGAGLGAPDAAEPPLLVHVLGAVARPGLVELAPGSRVVDAIAAAGGLTDDADPAGVNLARPVADGEQLRVPRPGEVPPPAETVGSPGAPGGGVVHVNSATIAELDTLPRIGPALAQRIVEYREANGPFASLDGLGEVAGIGDAVLAGLEGRIAL